MPKKNPQNNNKPQMDFTRVNEQIRLPKLMVINQNGQNLGIISNDEAKQLAREAGMDLVEVAPNSRPPVCRIMDYGKFKYEKGLKEKKQKNGGKTGKVKVIRLSPGISDNDIDTKVNNAKKFLEAGDKVLLQLRFKGREKAHKDVGLNIIDKIIQKAGDLGKCQEPKLQGSVLTCMIEPNKNASK